VGEERRRYRVLVGKPEGKRPLERPLRLWRKKLKLILRGQIDGVWSGFNWLRIRTDGGLL
jgi:hypothetical protein